jgi:hypothetical protein
VLNWLNSNVCLGGRSSGRGWLLVFIAVASALSAASHFTGEAPHAAAAARPRTHGRLATLPEPAARSVPDFMPLFFRRFWFSGPVGYGKKQSHFAEMVTYFARQAAGPSKARAGPPFSASFRPRRSAGFGTSVA